MNSPAPGESPDSDSTNADGNSGGTPSDEGGGPGSPPSGGEEASRSFRNLALAERITIVLTGLATVVSLVAVVVGAYIARQVGDLETAAAKDLFLTETRYTAYSEFLEEATSMQMELAQFSVRLEGGGGDLTAAEREVEFNSMVQSLGTSYLNLGTSAESLAMIASEGLETASDGVLQELDFAMRDVFSARSYWFGEPEAEAYVVPASIPASIDGAKREFMEAARTEFLQISE